MSLLEAFYQEYTLMNRVTEDDPEGGTVSYWTPGATVNMALDDPTQTQRLIAESAQVEVVQGAVFPIGTPVELGMYLQSKKDSSRVYRVQTNPVEAPGPASIRITKAEVIKTRLPK